MASLETQRRNLWSRLGQDGPWLSGTLDRVKRAGRRGRSRVEHRLTFKQAGNTPTVYVPQDLVKDVQAGIRRYRRIQALLRRGSELSLVAIRNYAPAKRAAAAKRCEKPSGRSGRPWARSGIRARSR